MLPLLFRYYLVSYKATESMRGMEFDASQIAWSTTNRTSLKLLQH